MKIWDQRMVAIKALTARTEITFNRAVTRIMSNIIYNKFINQHTIQPVLGVVSDFWHTFYSLFSAFFAVYLAEKLDACLVLCSIYTQCLRQRQRFHFSGHWVYIFFLIICRVLNQWGEKVVVVFIAFKNCQTHFCLAFVSRDISMYPNCERVHLCSCEQKNVQMVINKDTGLNSLTIKY